AQGGLKAMLLTKIKAGLSAVLVLGMLTAGTGYTLRSGPGIGGAVGNEQGIGEQIGQVDDASPPGLFRDVTAESGINFAYRNGEEAGHCAMIEALGGGVAVVDYDRDGWPDLLVTGWDRLALYHNEGDGKGGRRFIDVTLRAGLPNGLWTTSAAFADLDGDGFPDLYVCQYVDWSFNNHP